jgi:hypothetical protein
MALLIDTEGVRPERRASHFLDAVMASPLPTNDASHSRFEASDFRARFHFKQFGDLSEINFSANGSGVADRAVHEAACGGLPID